MKIRAHRFDSRWHAVAVAALVLLVGSVLPSPLHRHPEFSQFGPDKVLHFLGHACLAATLADAFATDRLDTGWAGAVAAVCSFVFGFVTGALQRYVPGRVPERADLVAGLFGSLVSVLGWWYVPHARIPFLSREHNRRTHTENA